MAPALRWAGYGAVAAALWLVTASIGIIAWLGLWDGVARLPAWAIPLQWPLYLYHFRGYHGVPEALEVSGTATTAVAGLCLASRAKAGGGQPLHGKAGWLALRAATSKAGGFCATRRPRGDAILLGLKRLGPFRRFVGLPGEEHAALTAKTRSGKGVSFVVPNALNWGGSLICFSVKRDVFEAAGAERVRKGDGVFVFDISDPERRTHRWNPLGSVRRGRPETYGDIQRTMFFLVPETKANNPFWDNAARKLATAVAALIADTPGMKLNIPAVLDAVQRPDWAGHLSGLIEAARREGRPYPRFPVNVVLGIVARKDEQAARDVLETLTTAFSLWNDPVVAAATEESDFDLGAVRSRRMSVFVCGGPSDIRIYRPIYGLLFQQLVQLNTRVEFGKDASHLPDRALGLLDEFWALGKQDVLADAAAFTASYGFRWAYVQQSTDQSVAAFGEAGARNLFSNTGARIDFGGDEKAAEDVSKWAGDNTVTETSRSRPRFAGWLHPAKQTESERAQRRRLILAQEIRRLSNKELLVRRGNLELLKLRRIVWYKDRWFKRMDGTPPEIAPLAVTVERDDGKRAPATGKQPAWAALP